MQDRNTFLSVLPRVNEQLADFHFEVAHSFGSRLVMLGEALEVFLGEAAAQATMRMLAVSLKWAIDGEEVFDRIGWREFIGDISEEHISYLSVTQVWWDACAYASHGVTPRERDDTPLSIEERAIRIRGLVAQVPLMLRYGPLMGLAEYLFVWRAVQARGALDFGGRLPMDGLQLLAGISQAAMRNAVIAGDLHPDAAGDVAVEEAEPWLARRREFQPSRWRDSNDDQYVGDQDPTEPDADGLIWVPQDAEGIPFTPAYVVRGAKGRAGISISIGAKGAEDQVPDYYAALQKLAQARVARWRRRNSAGNWGVVRARGAWVSVRKAEIDQQIADFVSRES